jgi:hypothetical protein
VSWGDTFRAAWHAATDGGRFFCAQLATGEHPVGVAEPGLRIGVRPDSEGWSARTSCAVAASAASGVTTTVPTAVHSPEEGDA